MLQNYQYKISVSFCSIYTTFNFSYISVLASSSWSVSFYLANSMENLCTEKFPQISKHREKYKNILKGCVLCFTLAWLDFVQVKWRFKEYWKHFLFTGHRIMCYSKAPQIYLMITSLVVHYWFHSFKHEDPTWIPLSGDKSTHVKIHVEPCGKHPVVPSARGASHSLTFGWKDIMDI